MPEHHLRRGDIVKLVDHHVAPHGTEGYSIEVFNALGNTIAVTSVPASALEALHQDEVLCARTLQLDDALAKGRGHTQDRVKPRRSMRLRKR